MRYASNLFYALAVLMLTIDLVVFMHWPYLHMTMDLYALAILKQDHGSCGFYALAVLRMTMDLVVFMHWPYLHMTMDLVVFMCWPYLRMTMDLVVLMAQTSSFRCSSHLTNWGRVWMSVMRYSRNTKPSSVSLPLRKKRYE